MKENTVKYFFWLLSGIVLAVLILASRSSGISCDEIIHYEHSVDVYNYFATGGRDTSSLHTPVSNLKYYGQSYDNIVTVLTRWLGITDVYTFRDMMSALMGWLTILVAALFAVWLRNYRTGLLVMFLLVVTPAFTGHSFNNLKDIPFAFAYISGVFLILRFLNGKPGWGTYALLTLVISFCISIRAGGLILICYLYAFTAAWYFMKYAGDRSVLREALTRLLIVTGISITAYFLSALFLWPYALQNPLTNIPESYRVMAHFPSTFRQIFEGKVEWSDFMPWYYLPKSMAITLPLVAIAGVLLYIILSGRIFREKWFMHAALAFTVIFPVVFVILEKSNLYSSWRQFLFICPGLVIISATGFDALAGCSKRMVIKYAVVIGILVLSVHPLRFMIKNHPYEYIYYNQLTGGLKGAYGKFETDYYYTSQTEAAAWLREYLRQNNITDGTRILATYSVDWDFRDMPGISTSWFRYEERSMHDWDYAIAVNRYIHPSQLSAGLFPPPNAIFTVYADSVPICAVLERRTKDDLLGYMSLQAGNTRDAVEYFSRAVSVDSTDEMIFYNFAGALYREGRKEEARAMLSRGLSLNPGSDLIIMYLANIALHEGLVGEAEEGYKKVIEVNRKYFEAYVSLARIKAVTDIGEARSILRQCLDLNPGYSPALEALGDTYKESDPAKAKRLYDLAETN